MSCTAAPEKLIRLYQKRALDGAFWLAERYPLRVFGGEGFFEARHLRGPFRREGKGGTSALPQSVGLSRVLA